MTNTDALARGTILINRKSGIEYKVVADHRGYTGSATSAQVLRADGKGPVRFVKVANYTIR
ncbi:hypothetical protein KNT99_gp90 [Gordonia phage NatB6]|uniref:Uncharacterized protein n=1 Tax=Gordonia phage NatB6 TaxID=2250322 RepID=A0A345L518_9CAUD|nr:hypothetical protein KNT99_gp90 [Gordonia phage NatB6]AXH50370.1 hypothetical protein SEA_NATB6_90 [Gordonia phage NatB6]